MATTKTAQDTARAVNAILDHVDAATEAESRRIALRDLRRISAVRGLATQAIRRRAWPVLLGCTTSFDTSSSSAASTAPSQTPPKDRQPHRDSRVVECDVARSLVHFSDVAYSGDEELAERRRQLTWILDSCCEEHVDDVYYYQGLHDIAGVLLLVVEDAKLAKRLLTRLCLHHLRDCTRPALDDVLDALQLVPALLRRHDPQLAEALADAEVPPHFALSWLLTWFSHGCATLAEAARLFDLLLGGHPLMPLYVGVVAMSQPACRRRLLECKASAQADDPDFWQSQAMAHMHKALTSLAIPGSTGADTLARLAFALYKRHPPEKLDGYRTFIGPLAAARLFPFEGRWRDATPVAEQRRYAALRARRQKTGHWNGLEPRWLTWLASAARKPGAPLALTGAAALGVWLVVPSRVDSGGGGGAAASKRWAAAGWAIIGAAVAVGTAAMTFSDDFTFDFDL